jgi:hypothetical protein
VRQLYERLGRIDGFTLPFQPTPHHLDQFADSFIEVTHHQLTCVQVDTMKERVTGVTGHLTFSLLNQNSDLLRRVERHGAGDPQLAAAWDDIQTHQRDYRSLVNLLCAFSFYSGLGKATARGMGMIRVR